MPRSNRRWVSQQEGSFHIISRIAGGDILLHRQEKEYLLKLLERFAAGFFVRIHSFCIMGNHFHILATGLEQEEHYFQSVPIFFTTLQFEPSRIHIQT
jgi:REP element-mobilizing transposase RayT